MRSVTKHWSYKNAQNTFSPIELGGLVCPRALVVGMGNQDDLFDYRQTVKAFQCIEEYYKAFHAMEKAKLVIYEGGHEVDKGDEELDFFFNELKK